MTGLSGLYNGTQGQKDARRHGEFAKTNPMNLGLDEIRKIAYKQGYEDAIEDARRKPLDKCFPFSDGAGGGG